MSDITTLQEQLTAEAREIHKLNAAVCGEMAIRWTGVREGRWGFANAARIEATEAAHQFFLAHPGHRQVRDGSTEGGTWPHVYERKAAASGAECLLWIGGSGRYSMTQAARASATEAAHWFFMPHPGHKQIREETPCTSL